MNEETLRAVAYVCDESLGRSANDQEPYTYDDCVHAMGSKIRGGG